MTDIVDLLRHDAHLYRQVSAEQTSLNRLTIGADMASVPARAADEIEQLRADRDLLVGVLRAFAVTVHSAPGVDDDQHWLGCRRRHPHVTAAHAARLRTLLDGGETS